MKEYVFKAQKREKFGKRSAALARAQGLLPINIYGHKQENQHLCMDYKAFEKFLLQGHRILTIEFDGQKEHGVVKEVQYDHVGTRLIHADIARVDLTEKIVMTVPVTTLGIAKGQSAGGILEINLKELPIEGPANAIPEKIEVPIVHLEIDQLLRVKDLTPPAGCRIARDPEDVVLAIHEKRIPIFETPVGPVEMPEVIAKKKEEPEEGEEAAPPAKEKEREKDKDKEKEKK
ncbi:MAG: 50S ribosomal protein L25 [Planctomycetes bacterium]|nr:50S ribosomal protein L25 [Planctomycetota bacterium]